MDLGSEGLTHGAGPREEVAAKPGPHRKGDAPMQSCVALWMAVLPYTPAQARAYSAPLDPP